jgi:magnesium transporter
MINAFACEGQELGRLADTSVEALSGAMWIDLLDATPDEIDRVQKATGLAVPTQAAVSEIESSSRLVSRDGALYLSMPLVKLSDDGPRSVSAGFILTRERLVTIRFAPNRIFDTYADQLPRGQTHTTRGLTSSLA